MALTINTNVSALNAQRNLGKSQNALANSMQRLSSGLRINSAKDDAAGLAISDRMTGQIRGLNQAARNANDGISLSQTAEGALQESTNILQRMRELAVQSANDTNSDSDRQSLNDEVTQLKAELDRIAQTTEFNGRKLIDGSMDEDVNKATFQVGSNAGVNQTISFGIASARVADLSQDGVIIEAPRGNAVVGTSVTGAAPLAAGAINVNGTDIAATASGSAIDIAAAINTAAGGATPIATATNVQTIAFSEVTLAETSATITAAQTTNGVTGSGEVAAVAEVQRFNLSATTVAAGETMTFTVAGEDVVYTNGTAGNLSGADLASAIGGALGTRDVGGTAGQYTFAQVGTTANLTISQVAGNESPIGAIVATNSTIASAPTASIDQAYVAGQAQEVLASATLDLSAVSLEDGATFTIDVGASSDFAFTNTTGSVLSGSALNTAVAAALTGTSAGDSGTYNFAVSAPGSTQLNISQAAGSGSTIAAVTTTNNSAIGAPSGNFAAVVEGSTGTAEIQTMDFAGVSVGIGNTITFDMGGGDTYVYTNNTAGTVLSGENLVNDIMNDMAGNADYIFAQNGGTHTQLDITQRPGNFSNIGNITTVNNTAAPTGPVVTDDVVAAVAGVSGEEQTISFAAATQVAAGESLTFTIDGTDVTYTNNTAAALSGAALVTDIVGSNLGGGAGVTNAINGRTYTFSDDTGGVLRVAEQDNAASAGMAAITVGYGSEIDPTGVQTQQGVVSVAEFQSFDFSATTVEGGETLTFAIDGQNVVYQNGVAGDAALSGAALVADIASALNDTNVGGTYYSAVVNGGNTERLDISQRDLATAHNIATITTINSTTAGAPTGVIIEAGSAGEVVGVAATAQRQGLDLSETTVEAGARLNFNIAGQTVSYLNGGATALSGEDLVDAIATWGQRDVGGGAGEYIFAKDGGTVTQLNITQAAGNESNIAAITTANTSAVVSPIATTTAEGVTAVASSGAVAEVQTMDLSAVSVAAGRSLNFTVAGEAVTYTNSTAGTLTGAALVDNIETILGHHDMGNGKGYYDFAQDGATANLTITQSAGNESNIVASTVVTPGTVDGTYGLELNGVAVDVTAATADASVTAAEVASAINGVAGFTATTNDDGAVVITRTDGAAFTLREAADSDGSLPLDAVSSGLAGIGGTATTFNGSVSLDSNSDIVLTGSGLAAAGLDDVGNKTVTIDELSVATREDAVTAIASVDMALSDIDVIRGGLGAVQNRFESTIANLNNVSENLSAARSRILDADIAMETSAMTKMNILQQAGVSILAQANQAPQLALSLLR